MIKFIELMSYKCITNVRISGFQWHIIRIHMKGGLCQVEPGEDRSCNLILVGRRLLGKNSTPSLHDHKRFILMCASHEKYNQNPAILQKSSLYKSKNLKINWQNITSPFRVSTKHHTPNLFNSPVLNCYSINKHSQCHWVPYVHEGLLNIVTLQ